MEKTKRKKIIGIGLVIEMVLTMVFMFVACKDNPVKSIEFYAEIKLPADMENLFYYRYKNSVFGEYPRQYAVFQLKEKPEAFLNDNGFIADTATPGQSYSQKFNWFSDNKFVPEEFFPPWNEEFVWASSNVVSLYYFINQQKLIAIV